MPVFDLTDDSEWIEEVQTMKRIGSQTYVSGVHRRSGTPVPKRRNIEVVGENKRRCVVEQSRGDSAYNRAALGHEAQDGSPMAAPDQPAEGHSPKFPEEDLQLIRDHRFRNRRVVTREVTASVLVAIMQELWARERPGQAFPVLSLHTVRRMLHRWGWSWRRAHKKRRPHVDPESALQFIWGVLFL